MNNYFDHNEDFSKAFRILDKRYIGVWSFIGGPSPSPAPTPAPAPVPSPVVPPYPALPPLPSGLPSSGAISLDDVQTEFGGSNPISISEYYGVDTGVPTSGTISLDDFYGKVRYSPSAGYFGGGGYPLFLKVQKISFATETLSVLPAYWSPLSPTNTTYRSRIAGVTNAPTAGYFAGGSRYGDNTFSNRIDRLQYSNDTHAKIPATLPEARASASSVETDSYGYFVGGKASIDQPQPLGQPPGPAPAVTNRVDRIQFSNETTSAPGTNLPENNASPALGTMNPNITLTGFQSDVYGYHLGWEFGSLYRLQFSNESTTKLSPLPNTNTTSKNGGIQTPSAGYYNKVKNVPTSFTASPDCISKMPFANETETELSTSLLQTRYGVMGVNNVSVGYFAGGAVQRASPAATYDTVTRFDFSNDTAYDTTATLPTGVQGGGCVEGG